MAVTFHSVGEPITTADGQRVGFIEPTGCPIRRPKRTEQTVEKPARETATSAQAAHRETR